MSRVGLVGAHDPNYARTVCIKVGLADAGHEVVDRGRFGKAAVSRLWGSFIEAWRSGIDVVWVTHPGYAYFVPAWIGARLRRRPIIFDAFVSLVETRFEERRDRPAWQRKFAAVLERFSVEHSHRVVFDTEENLQWFRARAAMQAHASWVVPVAVDPATIGARPSLPLTPPRVLWYGKFAPLHGVETILSAARLVEKQIPSLRFDLIGDPSFSFGWNAGLLMDLPTNCRLISPVPYDELGEFLASATVVLGVFGATPKTDRVVPNKVAEGLAAGKPVITGATTAMRRLVAGSEGAVLLVPPGDPNELAAAIVHTIIDTDARDRLADAGRRLHAERLSPAAAAEAVALVLSGLEESAL